VAWAGRTATGVPDARQWALTFVASVQACVDGRHEFDKPSGRAPVSVGGGTVPGVMISEFLAQQPRQVEVWSTGIDGLDHLVGGGFSAGQLWVLTGAPSSGKSTLLNQFVFTLGVRHRRVVDYFGSRNDHPDLIRARLVSLAVGREPAPGSLVVSMREEDERAAAELEALRSARISVSTGGGFVIEALGDSDVPGRCLVIDDPEGKRPPVLAREARGELRATANQGGLVLVTVPRSLCLERVPRPIAGTQPRFARPRERLREEWASVADVVVEISPTSVWDSELRLWQNRWGHPGQVDVTYQPRRSRFVGLAGGAGSRVLPGVPGEDVQEP